MLLLFTTTTNNNNNNNNTNDDKGTSLRPRAQRETRSGRHFISTSWATTHLDAEFLEIDP